MGVGTSDGKYYDSDLDYWHAQLFGEPVSKEDDKQEEPKLFMVRHGDTPANDEDIVHGWTNHQLNDTGIEQAHKAAESLKDKNITKIISSDLPRAKQTANILSKKLGGIPIEFNSNLRTWDAGDFDGAHDHKEFDKYTRPVANVRT